MIERDRERECVCETERERVCDRGTERRSERVIEGGVSECERERESERARVR